MTRQPSTRTAEPRTVEEVWKDHRCYACGQIVYGKPPPEAAAPAGLDVEALALVFAGITFSEWADAQGDTTRLFDLTRHVAAEYARLRQGTPRYLRGRVAALEKGLRDLWECWDTGQDDDVLDVHFQAARALLAAADSEPPDNPVLGFNAPTALSAEASDE